ncbi:MAG: FAD-dependent oxidoreductase [Solirubrobacterales bacterium]|nr:FAD-dependent oxidoreductase [Solirubrobacterales bacterium]
MRAAVIGAGPSGFYTTGMLLKAGFSVDLYDVLATPFGLVRAGVAPDHPKIKAVTRVFEKLAGHDEFRFFGGVELGVHVTREELRERYHAVVYAMGTSDDNRLGIPGEDLSGSHAATQFVAWYNGHPHHTDHEYDLSGKHALVIGNGNVAIDVARMLVLTPEELRATDTADHAIDVLEHSQLEEITLLGRRGPVQAAFTNPELRELGELTRADVVVDPADMELDEHSAAMLAEADGTTTRNVEIMRGYAGRAPHGHPQRVVLKFLRSPVALLGDGRVEAVRVGINRIEAAADGRLQAVPTGEHEELPADLVVRSIGYRGVETAGIPFDPRRGLIRNLGGRVIDDADEHQLGEYAVGWIKRGPSGVIGTNKKDAADTVARLLEDRDADTLPEPTTEPTEEWVLERAPDAVSWDGWARIDAHETGRGTPLGRPRVKLVRTAELHDVARRH